MAETRCGMPEERWVDFYAGNVKSETRDAMLRHKEQCSDCRRAALEWERLMERGDAITDVSGMEDRRRKLRNKVRMIGVRKRFEKAASRKGTWVAAVCIILLAFVGQAAYEKTIRGDGQTLQAATYAEKYEPNGFALMSRPDTVAYSLNGGYEDSPVGAPGNPAATVWVNGNTGEMFLLLEGLLPSDSLDVQAWGTIQDEPTNLGLIEFHRGQGHLYSRIDDFPRFEEVAFTIEPKGGSDQPTAPESVKVKLAH